MIDKLIAFLQDAWHSFKPIIFILQFEEGVLLRGGKFLKTLKPGYHFRIPFIDDYFSDNVAADTIAIKEVNVTTLDEKTISVGCTYDIEIIDIYKALIITHDWRSNLFDISKGIVSDHLEDCSWEEIRKKTTKNAIERKIQKRADEMGIKVMNFNFTDKATSRIIKLFNS